MDHLARPQSEVFQNFFEELRQVELYKLAGVAETLDWISALVALDREDLSEEAVNDTLGVLLKYQDDILQTQGALVQQIMGRVNGHAGEA